MASRLSNDELHRRGGDRFGRTNRQVADELYLSPKTVDAHWTAILTKLSVRDRSELTLYVTRHGASPDLSSSDSIGTHGEAVGEARQAVEDVGESGRQGRAADWMMSGSRKSVITLPGQVRHHPFRASR